MTKFPQTCLDNRAYSNRALAFNPQLPLSAEAGTRLAIGGEAVPPGVTMQADGSAALRFYAPKAQSVTVRMGETTYAMVPGEKGVWEGTIPYSVPGFQGIFFEVDGCPVLNPMAPIGFGWSYPVNYIEFPEEEQDFYQLRDVPHGTVAQEFYFSTVTGRYESCTVYLPPEYMGEDKSRYPVLYLQHGHGENEKCWIYQGKINFILDNLIADGKAVPCIIVMNNGMVQTTSKDGQPCMDASLLEDLLLQDCIPFIEKKYRVKTDRESRAMAGLSMGSMQTSILTMRHPELFAYAGIFSGFLRSFINDRNNNAHMAAMDDPDAFREKYTVFFRAIGEADPYRLIFEKESAHMAKRELDPGHWPRHILRYYPGAHEWQVWRKCARDFLQLIFR